MPTLGAGEQGVWRQRAGKIVKSGCLNPPCTRWVGARDPLRLRGAHVRLGEAAS